MMIRIFIQVDTLIKYLVDSLQSFENGHGDALHPIPLEQDESFMGDHTLMKNVTTDELRQLAVTMNTQFSTLMIAVQSNNPAACHQPSSSSEAAIPGKVPVASPDQFNQQSNVPMALNPIPVMSEDISTYCEPNDHSIQE